MKTQVAWSPVRDPRQLNTERMTAILMDLAVQRQPVTMAPWAALESPSAEGPDQSDERRAGAEGQNYDDQGRDHGPDQNRHSTYPLSVPFPR
jgi:hypothetical protein